MKASVLPKKNSKKVLITRGLQPLRKTATRSSKRSVLSVLQRTTTRYSKIALKSILVSHAFHTTFKALVVMLVTGTALYGAYAFIGNTFDNKVVVSKASGLMVLLPSICNFISIKADAINSTVLNPSLK